MAVCCSDNHLATSIEKTENLTVDYILKRDNCHKCKCNPDTFSAFGKTLVSLLSLFSPVHIQCLYRGQSTDRQHDPSVSQNHGLKNKRE